MMHCSGFSLLAYTILLCCNTIPETLGLLPRRYRPSVSWRWVEVGGIVINGVVTHWFGKSCGVYVPNPRTACRVVPNSVFATDSLRGMCPRVKLITAVAS